MGALSLINFSVRVITLLFYTVRSRILYVTVSRGQRDTGAFYIGDISLFILPNTVSER